MSVLTLFRRSRRERIIPVGMPGHEIPMRFRPDPAAGETMWEPLDGPAEDTRTATMPSPVPYEPHGIDTPEVLAALREQAEADARAAREAATQQWGTWDEPGTPLAPPPMPPGDLSQVMVNQIIYPDPADLSYDKDRKYRELYKRTGVATGTRASQEDTGVWALPALEPGDGTGAPL